MNPWRDRLLVVTVLATTAGYAWLFGVSPARLRLSLGMLSAAFLLAAAAVLFMYRRSLNLRLFTANLALGSIVHLVVAGIVVAADHLWTRGLLPGLQGNWLYFVLGLLGVGAALFTWARAKPRPGAEDAAPRRAAPTGAPEPPPPPSPRLEAEPAWAELSDALAARADVVRHRQLKSLERIAHVLEQDDLEAARRVVRQEVIRLAAESAAAAHDDDDDDLLSQAAEFFEWGVQKLPELAKLDVPDLLLAQCVAEIRASHDRVEHIFVPHTALQPIHPINRPTAEAKADARAAAARAALELIRANGMKLSEDFIAAHEELHPFKSVTGFQVVDVGEGAYVTFEGNGRAAALQRAFDDDTVVEVEVRRFCFDDAGDRERVLRRVQRVRESNGVLEIGVS